MKQGYSNIQFKHYKAFISNGGCLFIFGKILIFLDIIFYQHAPFFLSKFALEFKMPCVRWQCS